MKYLTILLLLLPVLSFEVSAKLNMLYADVKLTLIDSQTQQFGWRRVDDTTPKYPVKLARKGIAGCSVFKISINEKGKAEIQETLSYLPNKALLKESKKLLKNWKWQPIAGLDSSEATVRIDYCLGGASLEQAQQLCAEQSTMQCG